jgi:hypothetical protein
MAFTATEVSWFAEEPARSPIAWDANADPEAAPAIFGFVQLPKICLTFGTESTGGGTEGTADGQNTVCALTNFPEKTIVPSRTTSARTAPAPPLVRFSTMGPFMTREFKARNQF